MLSPYDSRLRQFVVSNCNSSKSELFVNWGKSIQNLSDLIYNENM